MLIHYERTGRGALCGAHDAQVLVVDPGRVTCPLCERLLEAHGLLHRVVDDLGTLVTRHLRGLQEDPRVREATGLARVLIRLSREARRAA
jgi:hypothetical protein